MLILSFPDTCSANPLRTAVTFVADVRVHLVEKVAVLAMRLSRVPFELGLWRVVEILSMRHNLKVIRTNTRGVDAAMVDLHPDGDLAIGERVGKSVCEPCSFSAGICPGRSQMAISRGKSPSVPYPAVTRPVGLSPETFFKRPNDLFRAFVHGGIAMSLPAAVVHSAPSTLLNHLRTTIDRALHVSIVVLCPVEGNI